MRTSWPARLGVSAPDEAQDPSLLPFSTWSETPAPSLDLTQPLCACSRLPRPAASPYYPADRSLHKYLDSSECPFATPPFSIMSLNASAPPFLHPTQPTRHHPLTRRPSQRHVASGQPAPSSSVSSGSRPRRTSSQVPSPREHEHEHEHEQEHEHGHVDTTEEEEDPPPHSPFLSTLWSLDPRAKYVIIGCMGFCDI